MFLRKFIDGSTITTSLLRCDFESLLEAIRADTKILPGVVGKIVFKVFSWFDRIDFFATAFTVLY
ncbi:MAG: hypothetical protein ACFFBL_11785 [Promethearchaeota archaeon]